MADQNMKELAEARVVGVPVWDMPHPKAPPGRRFVADPEPEPIVLSAEQAQASAAAGQVAHVELEQAMADHRPDERAGLPAELRIGGAMFGLPVGEYGPELPPISDDVRAGSEDQIVALVDRVNELTSELVECRSRAEKAEREIDAVRTILGAADDQSADEVAENLKCELAEVDNVLGRREGDEDAAQAAKRVILERDEAREQLDHAGQEASRLVGVACQVVKERDAARAELETARIGHQQSVAVLYEVCQILGKVDTESAQDAARRVTLAAKLGGMQSAQDLVHNCTYLQGKSVECIVHASWAVSVDRKSDAVVMLREAGRALAMECDRLGRVE